MVKRISKEDAALFREAVADATPAPEHGRLHPVRPVLKPIPTQTLLDEQQVLRESVREPFTLMEDVETGDALTYLRPGLPRIILRKMRSGYWVVQDELDLHGLRVDAARTSLVAFLSECKKRRLRCVRVVHGKGLRSRNREPVLKGKVRTWLMQRDEILAFIEARPAAGGSGAVILLLKAAG